MSLDQFSNASLVTAWVLYTLSFILFVITLTGKKWGHQQPEQFERKWKYRSFTVTVLGFVAHLTFFVTRWIHAGHIPTSNMFEFITFLTMMIIAAFIVVFLIYRATAIGAFVLPLAVIILSYAAVFPWESQPLVPSLNSNWLKIHVTTAALGEAFFAIGFAAGLMFLLRTINFKDRSKSGRRQTRWLEINLFIVISMIGFILATFSFGFAQYEAVFEHDVLRKIDDVEQLVTEQVTYTLPPLFMPHEGKTITMTSFLGMKKPLFEVPSWMNGANAGRKFNTFIWSIISGLILYGLLRLILRKPVGAAIQPILKDINPDDLDEISYRAISIGFPLFTLGALVFAMIWAQQAWGRFWGWDPKEVWALITWLFYSAYLHLRLSRGWHGNKSSWLAVIGFIIVLITLIVVNLVIAGLHSYAGV